MILKDLTYIINPTQIVTVIGDVKDGDDTCRTCEWYKHSDMNREVTNICANKKGELIINVKE